MSRGFKSSEFWFASIAMALLLADSIYGQGHAVTQIGLITIAYIGARGAKKFKHGEE